MAAAIAAGAVKRAGVLAQFDGGLKHCADPVGLFGSGGAAEVEPLEVGGPGPVEGLAGPPGIQPEQVDCCLLASRRITFSPRASITR